MCMCGHTHTHTHTHTRITKMTFASFQHNHVDTLYVFEKANSRLRLYLSLIQLERNFQHKDSPANPETRIKTIHLFGDLKSFYFTCVKKV